MGKKERNEQSAERVAPDLRAMSFEELERFIVALGERPFRARQIFRWLHLRGASRLKDMTDLPKPLRKQLDEAAVISSLEVAKVERSSDGTRKYAFRTAAGDVIESVFIPDASSEGRHALCISSQVGCGLDCKFCLTASLGMIRNLSSGEIVEQVTRVKADVEPDGLAVGNIVLMGMGEPLLNFDNVVVALKILMSDGSHGFSSRRITVSTAGVAPRIPKLGAAVPVNLAVSLNATTDEVRDIIMPLNKKWNIATLMKACRDFPLPQRRRVTFEYVLLGGVNDADEDARRLVDLVRPIRCKINLIPFNEHPYSRFVRPSAERIERFQSILAAADLTAMIRTPRGQDISAACGQLGVEVPRPRHSLSVVSGGNRTVAT